METDIQAENPHQAYFGMMEKVPSPVYYWAGMISIVVSLVLWISGKKQESLFVGQWPPTFFILLVVYKQVRPSQDS